MDKIFISELPLSTIIGTLPQERELAQKIIVDLEIDIDLAQAAQSDDLTQTIDYSEIEEKLVQLAAESKFLLIERFAQAVADIVFTYPAAQGCSVTITKPNASRRAVVKVKLNRIRP